MKRILFVTILSALAAFAAAADLAKGIELYQQKKYREAARELEGVVRAEPSNPTALTYLGLARAMAGDPQAALEPLQKAVRLDEENPEAHYGLGLAYGLLKRYDDAIRELERAVALDPRHAYAHYNLGLAYNQKKRKDKTVLHLKRFLELAPDAPEAAQVRSFLAKLG